MTKQTKLDGLMDIFAAYRGMSSAQPLLAMKGIDMYASGGLAAVIVDRPAQDATSRGWFVQAGEAPDDKAEDEFTRLDLQEVMANALRLARVEGAAGILVLTDDSPSLETPIDGTQISLINSLMPYGATRIRAEQSTYDDPTQPNYGEPTHYKINPLRGDPFVVHESRLLRVTGNPIIQKEKGTTGPCWLGRPALDDETITAIMAVKNAMQWTMRLLERKQQAVSKMNGLGQMVASGQEDVVRKRLMLIDLGRSVLNTVAVDKEDEFDVLDLSLTGVSEAIFELKSHLSACTGFMPISILFGQAPTGLNATGRADLEFYYGGISALQDRTVRPALEALTIFVYAQKGMKEPKEWHIEFEPMWVPSEQEQAEADDKKAARLSKIADTLAKLDSTGIMTPDELRNAAALMIPELEIKPGSAAPEPEPEDDSIAGAV